jgi:hypothetical protein
VILDLADALARDVERTADLVEGARSLAVQPEAELEDAPFSVAELGERLRERLVAELEAGDLVGQRLGLVLDEVAELGLVVVADGLLERERPGGAGICSTPDRQPTPLRSRPRSDRGERRAGFARRGGCGSVSRRDGRDRATSSASARATAPANPPWRRWWKLESARRSNFSGATK